MILNSNNTEKWKLINMRNVDDLLAVEFIHDLYNRHEPKINSIRFRHTVTVWKEGVVKSYAPQNEWDNLGILLTMQFYNLNESTIFYTTKLYERKREHFFRFIKKIENQNLTTLSNEELLTFLINFQSIVLGELYVLNFVQVEHGLNLAVKKVLRDIFKEEILVEKNFVDLIETNQPTKSLEEKNNFNKIILKWKFFKFIGFYNENRAKKDIYLHSEKYKYLYSAYGELPKKYSEYWQNFNSSFNIKSIDLINLNLFNQGLLSKKSKNLLQKINNFKLNILLPLLVRGGIFRDTNKALLGLSTKYRFNILDEISKRGFENRDNLRFYTLYEISVLLLENKILDKNIIDERKINGVEITRDENLKIFQEKSLDEYENNNSRKIKGICASVGEVEGVCKIVITKEDVHKVNEGDIMVAIGTDFDLIEAMYKSSAVITEEGGILSHASVVCREINKPCLIGVTNCTNTLKDGTKIRLNATQGLIEILD